MQNGGDENESDAETEEASLIDRSAHAENGFCAASKKVVGKAKRTSRRGLPEMTLAAKSPANHKGFCSTLRTVVRVVVFVIAGLQAAAMCVALFAFLWGYRLNWKALLAEKLLQDPALVPAPNVASSEALAAAAVLAPRPTDVPQPTEPPQLAKASGEHASTVHQLEQEHWNRMGATELEHEEQCKVRDRWLARALERGPAQKKRTVAKREGFDCKMVTNVCLRNSEIVYLGEPTNTNDVPVREFWFHPPTPKPELEAQFEWFKQKIIFQLPGYHDDGGKWVHRGENVLNVRMVANGVEKDLQNAPRLDITPMIAFDTWPFNFGDSFHGFIFAWFIQALGEEKDQHYPIIVPTPFQLNLMPFWHLLEPWAPSVESFATVGLKCDSGPICFKRVEGCKRLEARKLRPEKGGNKRWVEIINRVVKHHCPPGSWVEPKRPSLQVAFALRAGPNRRILNFDEIMRQCKGAEISGMPIVCEALTFGNASRDVCEIQRFDVLVSMHGAQLTNGMFMRPGSSAIELRPNRWWGLDKTHLDGRTDHIDFWGASLNRLFILANTTLYWWYGIQAKNSTRGKYSKIARDDDVKIQWPILLCMFKKILDTGGDPKVYKGLEGRVSNFAGCERPPPKW